MNNESDFKKIFKELFGSIGKTSTKASEDAIQASELICSADSLIVTAGAGMGLDSGLPDFRGDNGLWKAYPGLGAKKMGFSSIASPSNFESRPALAWGFYGHRLQQYRDVIPHEGFKILLDIGKAMPKGYFVFTSNVDGQFQKAGFDQMRIHECHGSIHALQCLKPCCNEIWPAAGFLPSVDLIKTELINMAPVCPQCGGIARPNILMFNDWGWVDRPSRMQEQAFDRFIETTSRPVVIELGAGVAIPSVRRFGEMLQRKHNAKVIRINLDGSPVPFGVSFPVGALNGIQQIRTALVA